MSVYIYTCYVRTDVYETKNNKKKGNDTVTIFESRVRIFFVFWWTDEKEKKAINQDKIVNKSRFVVFYCLDRHDGYNF